MRATSWEKLRLYYVNVTIFSVWFRQLMHYSFSQSEFDKSVKRSLEVYNNSIFERCHSVLSRITLEFIFLLFSLEPPDGTEVWDCLSWISLGILETVLSGWHPPGALIPPDQNLVIINVLLHSGSGSTEPMVGYTQREDKMTIRKATLEQRGTRYGTALSDKHCGAGGSQLREIR